MSKKIKFAIDLTDITRIESGIGHYVQNLLEGLNSVNDRDFEIVLFVGIHNKNLFEQYINQRIKLFIVKDDVSSKKKRLIWMNIKLSKLVRDCACKVCLEPNYSMPILKLNGIKYIATIHDLLAYHYPQFQSHLHNIWMRFMWAVVVRRAHLVVTISNFCKYDILNRYHIPEGKIKVIYNAVSVKSPDEKIFEALKERFNIEKKKYYYTVSKIRPNKNIETLVKVFYIIKNDSLFPIKKLLISGVDGGSAPRIKELIQSLGLENNIFFTGYVDDEERNSLYKNAEAFLFPSVFEGFGMPVVEAMLLGTKVVTTNCASLPEVSQGKANYVENPYDVYEWIKVIKQSQNHSLDLDAHRYAVESFANYFLDLIDICL